MKNYSANGSNFSAASFLVSSSTPSWRELSLKHDRNSLALEVQRLTRTKSSVVMFSPPVMSEEQVLSVSSNADALIDETPLDMSGPHEINTWGDVDVLIETHSSNKQRVGGIYRLNISPGQSIPLHVHRRMHEVCPNSYCLSTVIRFHDIWLVIVTSLKLFSSG
jgi:hypothetical protein